MNIIQGKLLRHEFSCRDISISISRGTISHP